MDPILERPLIHSVRDSYFNPTHGNFVFFVPLLLSRHWRCFPHFLPTERRRNNFIETDLSHHYDMRRGTRLESESVNCWPLLLFQLILERIMGH